MPASASKQRHRGANHSRKTWQISSHFKTLPSCLSKGATVADAPFALQRCPYARGFQILCRRLTSLAAVENLTVHNHGRNGSYAVCLRYVHPALFEIVDGHVATCTGHLLHETHGLIAERSASHEYLYFSFLCHCYHLLLKSLHVPVEWRVKSFFQTLR